MFARMLPVGSMAVEWMKFAAVIVSLFPLALPAVAFGPSLFPEARVPRIGPSSHGGDTPQSPASPEANCRNC